MTHLLFIDDILIFGVGILEEWGKYHQIINVFGIASGMVVSQHKYAFLYFEVQEALLAQVTNLFPYRMDPTKIRMKYIGYFIKPNCYHIKDWL